MIRTQRSSSQMRPTDGLAWSVCRSLSRPPMSVAKTAEAIEICPLRYALGLAQRTMYSMGVQIPICERAILRTTRRSIKSKRLSRGQNRYGVDTDLDHIISYHIISYHIISYIIYILLKSIRIQKQQLS